MNRMGSTVSLDAHIGICKIINEMKTEMILIEILSQFSKHANCILATQLIYLRPVCLLAYSAATPVLGVLVYILDGTPAMVRSVRLTFDSSTLCVLGSSPFSLSFWNTIKGERVMLSGSPLDTCSNQRHRFLMRMLPMLS